MKTLIAASLALILPAETTAAQPVKTCDVTVTFGSYAMGIDQPTFARVEKLLKRDRGVVRSEQKRWGREGEVTICVDTRRKADATRLFSRIRAMFPRKPRGPVSVETASGRQYRTPTGRTLPSH